MKPIHYSMRLLLHIPEWLKNKYSLSAIIFLVWIGFFDDRDLLTNYHHARELQELERSRSHFAQKISETKEELHQLKDDPATLEKYAREKYRMKRQNEDLFIVPE